MKKSCREGCKAVVKEAVKEAIEETIPEWKTKKYTSKGSGFGWKDWVSAFLLVTVPLFSLQGMFESFEFNNISKVVLIGIVLSTSFYAIGSWKGETRGS